MKTFRIYKDNYYYEDQVLYKKSKIEFKENTVSCLIGCNGIGKTTLVRQITDDGQDCLHKSAFDLIDGKRELAFRAALSDDKRTEADYTEFYLNYNKRTAIYNNEDDLIMRDLCKGFSSTGESAINDLGLALQLLFKKIEEHKGSTFYVVLDDLDVGVSINILRIINELIDKLVKKLIENDITYYIILTANSYELVKNRDCVSCIDFSHHSFTDYETYANYVAVTADWKNTRENKKKQKNCTANDEE